MIPVAKPYSLTKIPIGKNCLAMNKMLKGSYVSGCWYVRIEKKYKSQSSSSYMVHSTLYQDKIYPAMNWPYAWA